MQGGSEKLTGFVLRNLREQPGLCHEGSEEVTDPVLKSEEAIKFCPGDLTDFVLRDLSRRQILFLWARERSIVICYAKGVHLA